MLTQSADTGAGAASTPAPVRVAVLTSVHVPTDTRIYHRECKALAAAGYAVTLVAQDGIDAPLPGVASRPLGRARNRLTRVAITTLHAMTAALRLRARIVHLQDPELVPVGLLLRLLGRRVVYDVHEDYPERVRHKTYLSGWQRAVFPPLVAGMEWVAGRLLSAVVAATPEIATRFPRHRCIIVQNFPEIAELGDIATADYAERAPRVAYVGDLTRERGVLEAIEAIARCRTPGARLDLAGPVSCPAVRRRIDSGLPDNVTVHGRLGRPAVRDLLARARVGLVLLHPLPGYDVSWPVKLFEYMAAGLPIVASDFAAWRARFAEFGSIRFVDPRDPTAVAAAIDDLLADPQAARGEGEAGRAAVSARYSWEREREKLLDLYAKLRN